LKNEKKMKRRQKEKGDKTKNKTAESAMGQTVVAQKTNVCMAIMRSSYTLSGSLSSSEELLTSAGGAGGSGAAACFELFALVGRVDPFGGMVKVV